MFQRRAPPLPPIRTPQQPESDDEQPDAVRSIGNERTRVNRNFIQRSKIGDDIRKGGPTVASKTGTGTVRRNTPPHLVLEIFDLFIICGNRLDRHQRRLGARPGVVILAG